MYTKILSCRLLVLVKYSKIRANLPYSCKLLYIPTLSVMFVLGHTFFNTQTMTLIQMICFITLLIMNGGYMVPLI